MNMIQAAKVCLFLPLLVMPIVAETSVVLQNKTAQQATLKLVSDQTGNCLVKVSLVNDFGESYTPVHDVNPELFPGAANCIREGNLTPEGAEWTLVIGKRSADVAADKRRYSRSLANSTTYYYQVSVGEETATGNFSTDSIAVGQTYADVPFDRSRPGDYSWPSLDFSRMEQSYVDPQTGLEYRLMIGPEDLHSVTQEIKIGEILAPKGGWTGTGVGQSRAIAGDGVTERAFFKAAEFGQRWSGLPMSMVMKFGVIGTGAGPGLEFRYCITVDGSTCFGKVFEWTIDNSKPVQTVGDLVPMMAFWRTDSGSRLTLDNMRMASGSLSKRGAILTWEGGNLFPLSWGPGSRIQLGANGPQCELAQVKHQRELVLQDSGCARDGGYSYQGQNFGLLAWKQNSAPGVAMVYDVQFQIQLSGQLTWTSYGGVQQCSPVRANGPDGGGWVCAAGGTVHTTAGYTSSPVVYYISQSGRARSLGMLNFASGPGFARGVCSLEQLTWDRETVAVYCVNSSGTQIVKGTYVGRYDAQQVKNVDENSVNWQWSVASGDLTQTAQSYHPGFRAGSNYCKSGWRMAGMARARKMVVYCWEKTQDTPGWVGVYDVGLRQFAGLHSTFGGKAGAGNRWSVVHSVFGVGDEDMVLVQSVAGSSPVSYQANVVSGALNANFSPCPSGIFDSRISGQSKCSTLTVDSLVLRNPGDGSTLANEAILPGDYLQVMVRQGGGWSSDRETVRVQQIAGTQVTVERLSRGANLRNDGFVTRNHEGTLALAGISSGWKEYWWNYKEDPLGEGRATSYGNTVMNDVDGVNCHQVYQRPVFIASCPEQPNDPAPPVIIRGVGIRSGLLPDSLGLRGKLVDVNFNAGANGVEHTFDGVELESHPSRSHENATAEELRTTLDLRPYAGNSQIGAERRWTRVGDQLYRLGAEWTKNLMYGKLPLLMTSGEKVLADISPGPIVAGAAGSYQGCYVVKADDCQPNSKVGEVYMNAPQVAVEGCWISRFSNGFIRDLCVTNHTFAHGALQQFDDSASPNGERVRKLGSGLAPYKIQNAFWNPKQLPDNSWVMIPVEGLDGVGPWADANIGMRTILLARMPGWPATTALAKGNEPKYLDLNLGDKTGLKFARVLYGYRENGKVEAFHCSPRQKACVVGQKTAWEDQNPGLMPCENGCKMRVPVIAGRVMYYSVERMDANGKVKWTEKKVHVGI